MQNTKYHNGQVVNFVWTSSVSKPSPQIDPQRQYYHLKGQLHHLDYLSDHASVP